MKNVVDLLRGADPLQFEPSWSSDQRAASRQAMLAATHTPPPLAKNDRPWPKAVIAAAVSIVLATGIALWSRSDARAAVRFDVQLAEVDSVPGFREVTVRESNRKIYLHPESVVTNSDIVRAEVVPVSDSGSFNVVITFSPHGAQKMRRATQQHIGKPLALSIDGKVAMVPVVRSPISTSEVLSGDYSKAEADRIANGISRR
jgi:hypothetical protein